MKSFYLVEVHKGGDEFILGSFENKEAAIKEAKREWLKWCKSDKEDNTLEIREAEVIYDEIDEEYYGDFQNYDLIECVSLRDGRTRRFLDNTSITECEVKERPNTGRWKKVYLPLPLSDSTREAYRCSECSLTFDSDTNYCPNCGADMNKELERIINNLKDTKDRYERQNYNNVFGYHISD
ncbi:MAG: hypothetical protein J6S67_17495 [Methanobrevibacter sp.]|nr:hypothetical protein [Methanobrevibacter sp.]